MDRELRRLAEQPGNPLFGTMQAFAWEFQEAFRYWLDHQPRRTLKVPSPPPPLLPLLFVSSFLTVRAS